MRFKLFGKQVYINSGSRVSHDHQLHLLMKTVKLHGSLLDVGGGTGENYIRYWRHLKHESLDIVSAFKPTYVMDFTRETPKKKIR